MKVFTVVDPIFKTEPLFIFGCTRQELASYRRRFRVRLDRDDSPCEVLGTMFTFSVAPWRVVWVAKPSAPAVLHEVFHLVTRICADRGVPIVAHHPNGENGDETAAYLFEYFAKAVLRRLRRA